MATAKATNGLTAKRVERLRKPGRYHDGHGLHLVVTPSGTKNWQLRYERNGAERWHGLGPIHTVSLKEARDRARAARLQLLDGVDPIKAKKDAKAAAALAAARALTFREASEQYYRQHAPRWRDRKSGQFLSQLRQHVFPKLGALSVADVDTGLVLRVIEPLWSTKTETASRLRRRIETILDWATVRGYRTGDNPARWAGHLREVLPPPDKTRQVKHHAALPFVDLPAFMSELVTREGIAARALEVTILTAARTSEAIGAKWDEFDLEAKVWTVPPGRMKGNKEHRVPLSEPVLEILRGLPRENDNDHVFVSASQSGAGLSNMGMAAVLRRMGRDDVTVHGFRSTFRDWGSERTSYQNHVLELALSHAIGSAVEAAYRRGDLLDKRRRLMTEWAKFATGKSSTVEVVGIREAMQ